MALMKKLCFFVGLIFCNIIINSGEDPSASKLSVPRVLLPPFRDLPINFTLDISDGGCYKCLIKHGFQEYLAFDRRKYATEAQYEIERPYKLYRLDVGPETKVKITKEDALEYFTQMTVIRKMENALASLYKERQVRGFCHLCVGQEACGVGMKAALQKNDTVITSYRAHGWAYLQGGAPHSVIAELMGRLTGRSRGKGGSMHMYAQNFFGGNGIVGAQVSLGLGSGFFHKYANTGGISFALYGDGAANQGQVHESYNLAKVLNIPVVFVCENNKYGMGTADYRSSGTIDYYTRGCFLPGIWVDGMDILAVREATRFAKAHILANKGPFVLELETYRYFGHSMSDPGTSYRTREEVQNVRKLRDPITKFKEKMVALQLLNEGECKTLEKSIAKQIEEEVKKTRTDPYPKLEELAGDVYVKPLVKSARGLTPFQSYEYKTFGKLTYKH